jgi:NAD(P)-dependent dehydrogenase (short-subunit alcohol dehydrogenase family)
VASFRRLFDINVAGTLIVTQAVAKEVMKTDLPASMVLVGSISGSVSNRVRIFLRIDSAMSNRFDLLGN